MYPKYGPIDPCGHHYHHCPENVGRVKINGVIELKCRFVDHHGHTKYFDIKPGEMYNIEAISSTRGLCNFIGKIVDFDSIKGVEKILDAPHVVEVGALIVDYSDEYDSKVIKIRVDNITKIIPVESVNNIDPRCRSNYIIYDPFAKKRIEDAIEEAEEENEDGEIEYFV